MNDRTPAQQFYDTHGFYQRQDTEARLDSTYLAWAADMHNSRRHCWEGKNPDKNDEPTRWLDTRAPEYIEGQRLHGWDDDESWKICRVDHSANPKVVGNIEWMRFIHEWGALAPEGQRYFTDDGTLWIAPTGQPTSDGRLLYAECYFNQRPADKEALKSFSFRMKFALFLANGQEYARLECYDPELADLCQQVWLNVQASYGVKPWIAAAS
jgi:hypothetical protein